MKNTSEFLKSSTPTFHLCLTYKHLQTPTSHHLRIIKSQPHHHNRYAVVMMLMWFDDAQVDAMRISMRSIEMRIEMRIKDAHFNAKHRFALKCAHACAFQCVTRVSHWIRCEASNSMHNMRVTHVIHVHNTCDARVVHVFHVWNTCARIMDSNQNLETMTFTTSVI